MALFSSHDTACMQRVLELALRGQGQVAPNPLVGCVITKDNNVIGEGWHQRYGEAHAERNAVRQVDHLTQLVSSTVYVNLEPCSHFGKTPPCCDLLIQHRVARVVISNLDPNPMVNGAGILRMRQAGIQVDIGLLAEEATELNQAFFQRFEQGAYSTDDHSAL